MLPNLREFPPRSKRHTATLSKWGSTNLKTIAVTRYYALVQQEFPPDQAQVSPAQLRSWKEISAHLGVSVKTVQRWEKLKGLPVHRIDGTKEVFAYPDELDLWKRPGRRSWPHRFSMRLRSAIFSIVVLAALAILWSSGSGTAIYHSVPQNSVVLDGAAPKILKIIPVGRQPSISFRPKSSPWVLVSNYETAQVSVINATSLSVVQTIEVDPKPTLMGGPADGSFVYLLHSTGKITRIESANWKVRTLANVRNWADDLEISADGRTGYVTATDHGVLKFDTGTGVVTTLRQAGYAYQLSLDSSGHRLAVTYLFGGPCGVIERDCIEVLDARSGKVLSSNSRMPGAGMTPMLNPGTGSWWVGSGDVCIRPHYKHTGCPTVPGSLMYSLSPLSGEISTLTSYRGGASQPVWFTPDGMIGYVRVGPTLETGSGVDGTPRYKLPLTLAGTYVSSDPSPVAFIPLILENTVAAIEWLITIQAKLLDHDCPSLFGRKGPPACIVIEPSSSFDPTLIEVGSLMLDGVSISESLVKDPVYLGRISANAGRFTNMVVPLTRRPSHRPHELRGITTGGVVVRAAL